MAQKASKQLAARNKATLNRTLLLTLGIHGSFILLRLLLRPFTRSSFLTYMALSAPSWLIQFWFERMSRPTFDAQTGELRRAGEDLEAQGLTEWMWDVLYWTYGCLVLVAVVGEGAWWLWVGIPIYSAYLAYTTFTGARRSMAGLAGAGSPDQGYATGTGTGTGSKRQQKIEKRGQRVQYR